MHRKRLQEKEICLFIGLFNWVKFKEKLLLLLLSSLASYTLIGAVIENI